MSVLCGAESVQAYLHFETACCINVVLKVKLTCRLLSNQLSETHSCLERLPLPSPPFLSFKADSSFFGLAEQCVPSKRYVPRLLPR